MHRSTRRLIVGLAFSAASLLSPGLASAGLILELKEIVVLEGEILVEDRMKFATGQAVATNLTTGASVVSPMPPGGGTVTAAIGDPVTGNPVAVSSVTVDLAQQHASVRAIALSGEGDFTGTTWDIHEVVVVQAIPVTVVDFLFDILLDPNEVVDAYFGPGAEGELEMDILFEELTTGTVLFDSSTTFTPDSPDLVSDTTGMLSWMRVPGFFGGGTGGIPNFFSDARWELQPFDVFIEFPFTFDTADPVELEFALTVSASGSSTGGSSPFGFSSVVPEPSGLLLLALGALGLLAGGGRWGRRA